MTALPLGYKIQTQQNGALSDSSPISEQAWQRLQHGGFNWTDIGITGSSYTITQLDKNCQIRQAEKHQNNQILYSNALQVEDFVVFKGEFDYAGVISTSGEPTSIGVKKDFSAIAFGMDKSNGAYYSPDGGATWQHYPSNVETIRAIYPDYIGGDRFSPRLNAAGAGGGDSKGMNHSEIITKSDATTGAFLSNSPSSQTWYGMHKMEGGDWIGTTNTGGLYLSRDYSDDHTSWVYQGSKTVSMLLPGGIGHDGGVYGCQGNRVYRFVSSDQTGNFIMENGPALSLNSGASQIWQFAQWPNGDHFACGDKRSVLTSSNFTNSRKWVLSSVSPFPSGTRIRGCAFLDGKMYVAGISSYQLYFAYSTDGNNWTQQELPGGVDWHLVKFRTLKMTGGDKCGALVATEKDNDNTHVWNFA